MEPFFEGISVIIPTFNRSDKIGITLQSFIDQDFPNDLYEIIVVDNGSTDDTKKIIDDYARESSVPITYLFEERQGVHFARNRAVWHARFPLLYYTDDDMRAHKALLVEIGKPLSIEPKIGSITGRVLPEWETTPPNWILNHCYNSILSLHDRAEDLIISKTDMGVISCHQAILKKVLIEAGGFNPENTAGVWIGDGETGLNLKVRKLGYKFAYMGSSITYHILPAQRFTQTYLNRRLGNQGFCDSYTDYNKMLPSNLELIIRAMKRSLIKAPAKILLFILKSIYYKDLNYLRFCPAYVNYFIKRNLYDCKIITDRQWKAFVQKKDWISDHRNRTEVPHFIHRIKGVNDDDLFG